MILASLACTLAALATALPAQTTWSRDTNLAIPLLTDSPGGTWGEPDRKADHAVVATNSVGDVLVAFHSSRPGYNPSYPTLKQVEIALFERQSVTDTWTLDPAHRVVVGGVDPSPLSGLYIQSDVKCERPDVIAVGEWFFVVWTRVYERNYGSPSSPQTNEPAVLECAWVRKLNGNLVVYTGTTTAGQGKILDADDSGSPYTRFYVRECAGCPDAVVLDAPASGPLTVGVSYPHQTDFGDYTGDATRLFELRFVTCTMDPATLAITSFKYPPIVASPPVAPPTGL